MRVLWRLWLAALLFASLALLHSPTSRAADNVPALTVSVFLEQGYVRDNEPLQATIFVANPTAQPVSASALTIIGPDFIKWSAGVCGAGEPLPAGAALELGPIAPYSTLEPVRLCATLGSNPRYGAFNALFRVTYSWNAEGGVHSAAAATEKAIKTDLLGADSLLGVPLALAGLLLPGALALLMLRITRVAFAQSLGPEEKLAFSMAVSLALVGLAALAGKLFPAADWPRLFALTNDISVSRLVALAVTGVVLGVFAGGLIKLNERRVARQKRQAEESAQKAAQALRLAPEDSCEAVVRKMLTLNPNYSGIPVRVQEKKSQGEFRGSHWAQQGTTLFLVGAFRIRRTMLPGDLLEKVQEHSDESKLIQDRDHLLAVLELVAGIPDAVDALHAVEEKQGGAWQTTGQQYKAWNRDEVAEPLPDRDYKARLLELR